MIVEEGVLELGLGGGDEMEGFGWVVGVDFGIGWKGVGWSGRGVRRERKRSNMRERWDFHFFFKTLSY